MKHFLLLAGSALLLAASPALAQTPAWQNAQPYTATGSAYIQDWLQADAQGNAYVGGNLDDEFSTSTAVLGSTIITVPAGATGGYLAKLTPAGVWQWALPINATPAGSFANVRGVVTDAAGNVYVSGYAYGTGVIVGTTTVNAGTTSIRRGYVAQVSPTGTVNWITMNTGGSGGIGFDAAANQLVVVGDYNAASTFGTTTLPAPTSQAVYVARLSTAGAYVGTVATSTGSGQVLVRDVEVSPTGEVAITGYASGTPSFGTSAVTANSSGTTLFVAKLNAANAWQWAQGVSGGISGGGYDRAAVSIDAAGNVTLGGQLAGANVAFGTTTLHTPGAYLARLSSAGQWQWAIQSLPGSGGTTGAGTITGLTPGLNGAVLLTGGISGAWGTFSLTGPFAGRVSATGKPEYALAPTTGTTGSMSLASFGNNTLFAAGLAGAQPLTLGTATVPAGSRFVARLTSPNVPLAARTAAGMEPLAVWPNPVAGGRNATLRLSAPAPAALPVILRDVLGRTVGQATLPAGRQEAAVPTTGLTPGHYLLQAGTQRAQLVVE